MINTCEVPQGLREMADFLEHFGITCMGHPLVVNIWCDAIEEMAAVARRYAPLEKIYVGEYFVLRRSFPGGVRIEWNIARDQICERVVVGRREKLVPAQPATPATTVIEDIVEWRCAEPLLAHD